MASGSNWLSGVNVVLVMAYGSLVRRPPFPPSETPLLSRETRGRPFSETVPVFLRLHGRFWLGFDCTSQEISWDLHVTNLPKASS